MKKLIMSLVSAAFVLLSFNSAMAITFSEVSVGSVDPTIGAVSFFAGDGASSNDTYVTADWTPGNNYLMSGFADGTGNSPASGYDTFIGVSAPSGEKFGTVTLDILSEYNFPAYGGNTSLTLAGYLSGVFAGSITYLGISDNDYRTMNFGFGSGADTLFIYDNLNSFGLGEAFHIDNFAYTIFNDGGGQPVPEPSTLLLLGAGLAGAVLWRRRKSA